MYISKELEDMKRKDVLKAISQQLDELKKTKDIILMNEDWQRRVMYERLEDLYRLNFEEYCKKHINDFSALINENAGLVVKYKNKIVNINGLKNVTISYTRGIDGKWETELTTTK